METYASLWQTVNGGDYLCGTFPHYFPASSNRIGVPVQRGTYEINNRIQSWKGLMEGNAPSSGTGEEKGNYGQTRFSYGIDSFIRPSTNSIFTEHIQFPLHNHQLVLLDTKYFK